MKTKLVVLIALVMVVCICLAGCSYEMPEIERVYDISYENIYVDAETGVMYLWQTADSKGGLTVMLNADGTPKIYNKDASTYENVYNISSENIYVDTETGVMYLWQAGHYQGGLTVMLNADGTPKIYNKDASTYENVYNISSESIYVDTETGVMYLWQAGHYQGGLTVMLNSDGTPKVYNKDANTYENVYNISSESIYVDTETKVMYLWRTGYAKGGLTVMLNADGTPKIYNKDTNTYKNVYDIKSEIVFVDKETGTMYLWQAAYYKGGLTVMLNANGTPKTLNNN